MRYGFHELDENAPIDDAAGDAADRWLAAVNRSPAHGVFRALCRLGLRPPGSLRVPVLPLARDPFASEVPCPPR